jgi:hypothetical protein
MPLIGEYEPGTSAWSRRQAELQDGPTRRDYTACEVTGNEKAD